MGEGYRIREREREYREGREGGAGLRVMLVPRPRPVNSCPPVAPGTPTPPTPDRFSGMYTNRTLVHPSVQRDLRIPGALSFSMSD